MGEENMNQKVTDEEISLREIVEIIWDGKKIISLITVIAILISFVYSFFMIETTYKTKASLTINPSEVENNQTIKYFSSIIDANLVMQQMKNPKVLEQVIKEPDLNTDKWSITSLQNSLNVTKEDNSDIISVDMEGLDPNKIANITNATIKATRTQLAADMNRKLEEIIAQYKASMEEEQEKLNAAIAEYNAFKERANLPTLVLFEDVAGGNYQLEANRELLEELREFNKEDQVKFKKVTTEVNRLTNLYNSSRAKYEEAKQIDTEQVISNQVVVLSEALALDKPVDQNKLLNIAIGLVLGLMLGIGVVFIRNYWIETSK
ncbi:Wzz/FepE/Etk N-terminal domain-containing protein [Terrihalobacillus insolitus]|uniref:Wzz/FepE/Etk N-terminal domain-containing protein n=1 Tax=Terrihalobacillus insolitus TaxID=2950438 RepID=UPI0023418564|nr:Wzz/FepE/Etk N-terminal domain-containing protein [Terrihalobacillus insolitus]MDC3411837.1 Wzz/FepE/Etk N-terminal domain-containing protein [Terrihalobacillus insolitus]